MSNPDQKASPAKSFNPMTHNSAWWNDDEGAWSPFEQQRPMVGHITEHQQEDFSLPLQTPSWSSDGQRILFEDEEFEVKEIRISPETARIQILADAAVFSALKKKMGHLAEPPQRIEHPPATNYISILKSILTRGSYDRIVAPYIAQEQHEYYEALLKKDMQQAKVIKIRMYLLLTWLSFQAFVSPVICLFTRAG